MNPSEGALRINQYCSLNPSSGKPIRKNDKQHRVFKLTNNVGDNNCFLNVFLQNFWHLEGFRSTLKQVIRWKERNVRPGHKVNQLFSQLAILCNQILDVNEEEELTVDILKQSLFIEMSNHGSMSQLNSKADAIEAFQLILNAIHEQLTNVAGKDLLECTCTVHPACQLDLTIITFCKLCNTEEADS